MRRRSLAFAFALALALVVPSSAASWSVWGSTEPDTTFDRTGNWMWPAPDTARFGSHVYFDVVAEATPTGQNPNEANIGTRAHAPSGSFTAFLGAWKDCDRDGYIGHALGALLEYRTELLLGDESVCPQSDKTWNDGLWVTEFRMIGPATDTRSPGNFSYVIPRLINDTSAEVWGDYGAPSDAPTDPCPVTPIPRGTSASTGGLQNYVDCFDNYLLGAQGLLQLVPDTHTPVSLYGDPEIGGAGLLQRHSGDQAATVFDCAQPKGGLDARDPSGGPRSIDLTDPTPNHLLTGSIGPEGIAQVAPFQNPDGGAGRFHRQLTDGQGSYVWLAAIAPSVNDPAGSYADAASNVELATVEKCDPQASAAPIYAPGQAIDLVPAVERDVRATDLVHQGKRQNDIVFDLTQYTTSYQEGGTLPDGRTGAPFFGDLLGHSMPQDGGLAPARDVGGSGPGWHSMNAGPQRAVTITRADLDPTARTYLTFYASVGFSAIAANDLALPNGGITSAYGSGSCGSSTTGVHNGWDCDATHWWRAPAASARPENPYSHRILGARVGDTYNLRDVDCESDAAILMGAAC